MQDLPKRIQAFVDRATDMARDLGFNAIDGPLLLASVAVQANDPAAIAIGEFRTIGQCIMRVAELAAQDGHALTSASGKARLTPAANAIIFRAGELAKIAGEPNVDGRHVLLAALESNPNSSTWRFIIWLTDREVLKRRLAEACRPAATEAPAETETPAITVATSADAMGLEPVASAAE